MSIANDARSYADNAIEAVLEQGKHVLEAAQSGLDKLQHNVLSAKAVGSLTPSVDAVRGTVEPLVATALTYGVKLAGKAEAAVTDLKKDKRVAQVLQTGEALASAVVGAVQQRVGGVASAASAASAATKSATKSATETVTKAAQTRPARPAAARPVTKATPTTAAKATATRVAKPTGATKATAAKPAKPAKSVPAKAAKSGAVKSVPAKSAASRSNGQRA